MKKVFIFIISWVLWSTPVLANKAKDTEVPSLSEIVLPSEVKGLSKAAGSVFYSPFIKGKVLVPVNIWGSVKKSGLHFVPMDTSLMKGLSLAGGVFSESKLDNVRLTRKEGSETKNYYIDFTSSSKDIEAQNLKLRSGDIIFVDRDYFRENRAYYTSLIGVFISMLSGILIYRQVKRNQKTP